MGQKVNPHGLRVGVISGWDTQWYADKKNFAKFIKEDNLIRTTLKKKYYAAAISKITIERATESVSVNLFCGRPGLAIGKEAAGIAEMKKIVRKISSAKNVNINVHEVKKVDLDAQLAAVGSRASRWRYHPCGIAHHAIREDGLRRCRKMTWQRNAVGIAVHLCCRIQAAT